MKYLAIDIETTGLRPYGGKIYCYAWNDGKSIGLELTITSLAARLRDPDICKVVHNAAFDLMWILYHEGIPVRNVWDTRLCEQILLGDNLSRSEPSEELRRERSSSLKYVLERYGYTVHDKSLGAKFATRRRDALLTKEEKDYAKADVAHLLDIRKAQEALLTREGLMEVAMLENKTVEVVAAMRSRGIGFDQGSWDAIAVQNEAQYLSILKRLPSGVNWNSPKQLVKYFSNRGVLLLNGQYETLEEAFNKSGDKVLGQVLNLRFLHKNVTTFGRSWYTEVLDPDGRVRCDFEQILNTGRFSSSLPNLQQIPTVTEHRAAFIPSRGSVFVIGDFGGQEIGIMAAASKEDIWIDAMLRGDDVHSLTASLLYREDWEQGKQSDCTFPKKCRCKVHLAARERAKVLNFMLAYGGGPQRFSIVTGLPLDVAKETVVKYKKVIPKLTKWLERNGQEALRTRESFSCDPYRRRRVLRDPEDWQVINQGKNTPVQSSGANMLKLSMISVPPEFPIVLVIHDEIILEVKKKDAARALKALKIVMEKSAAYCTGIAGLIKVEPRIATNLMKL